MTEGLLLGLDVGGTKSAVVLGDRFGNVLAREEIPTAGPDQTIERLVAAAKSLSARHSTGASPSQSGGRSAAACGIACGGPLSSGDGVILSPPNLPGWDFVPIVQRVRDELHLPARLENDANAAALAEWRWGLGQRIDDLLYLTCGTGQGAGIVLDGRLHRGRQDLAGEIGHVRLLPLGPVGYHKAGSVEGLTGSRGIGELARLRLQETHQASALDRVTLHSIDGRAVADAAAAGDAFALGVVKESACYLGKACAILIDLLNPQRISLGGLALKLGKTYVDEVRRCAREEALPASFEACDIDAAALGHRAQDLAALAVASLAAEEAEIVRSHAADRARRAPTRWTWGGNSVRSPRASTPTLPRFRRCRPYAGTRPVKGRCQIPLHRPQVRTS